MVSYEQKHSRRPRRAGGIVKRLALLAAAFAVIRLLISAGAGEALEQLFSTAAAGGTLAGLLVRAETQSPDLTWADAGTASLLSESAILRQAEAELPEPEPDSRIPQAAADEPVQNHADNRIQLPVLSVPSGESAGGTQPADYAALPYTLSADLVELYNKTEYTIDTAALLGEPLHLAPVGEGPQVLIIHTHGSEAYAQSDGDAYTSSDPMRTEDKTHNMIRVGTELAQRLEASGICVIHDTELYDYPSYTGSYSRTLDAIESYLAQYPTINVVIDLHRDAVDELTYKTTATVDGASSAQVMTVVGTNFSGLEHGNWHENLKLAMHLQCAMLTRYPGLARPITISQYRYNQHATTGSLIVEIGYSGNTLSEALTAARGFSDALSDVLLAQADG